MSQLARSGGRRTTDAVELFPLPDFDEETYLYRTYFLAHAIRYLPNASQQRIQSLRPEERLLVMHDCQNEVDPKAIALRTMDRVIVGHMPSFLLEDAHDLVWQCSVFEVFVARVNPSPAPMQQRLLCRLQACWPDDFTPFSSPRYQPISPEATPTPRPTLI